TLRTTAGRSDDRRPDNSRGPTRPTFESSVQPVRVTSLWWQWPVMSHPPSVVHLLRTVTIRRVNFLPRVIWAMPMPVVGLLAAASLVTAGSWRLPHCLSRVRKPTTHRRLLRRPERLLRTLPRLRRPALRRRHPVALPRALTLQQPPLGNRQPSLLRQLRRPW